MTVSPKRRLLVSTYFNVQARSIRVISQLSLVNQAKGQPEMSRKAAKALKLLRELDQSEIRLVLKRARKA